MGFAHHCVYLDFHCYIIPEIRQYPKVPTDGAGLLNVSNLAAPFIQPEFQAADHRGSLIVDQPQR